MSARTIQVAVIAMIPLLSVAVVVPRPAPAISAGQCNTGSLQCCNSIRELLSADFALASLRGVVDIPIGSVGVDCSPISLIGAAGNSCSSQPVCCSNNSFNGIVAFGCNPINVNL